MSKPTTRDLMIVRQKELEAEVAKIEAKVSPLRQKRDALRAKIQPVEDEMRVLNAEIKAVEQPALSEAKLELAALARALQSKSMRVDTGAVKAEG